MEVRQRLNWFLIGGAVYAIAHSMVMSYNTPPIRVAERVVTVEYRMNARQMDSIRLAAVDSMLELCHAYYEDSAIINHSKIR